MAVVEADALAQPDAIRLMIRRVPRNGESRREARLIVPSQQSLKSSCAPARSSRRCRSAGRGCWGDRDSDGDDAGFGRRLRAACRQQQQRQIEKSHSAPSSALRQQRQRLQGRHVVRVGDRAARASFSGCGIRRRHLKQPQLLLRLRRRAADRRPAAARQLVVLERFENRPRARDDRCGHAREPGDLDAIAAIRSAGHDLVQGTRCRPATRARRRGR